MALLGGFIRDVFAMEMVFFDIHITYGQFFIFTWLAVLVVGFIRGLFW